MNKLSSRFIVSEKPKEYLVQGPSHCGAYSVKGILSAFGKDDKGHPKEYHPIWLGKLTGGTFGKNYWVNVLKEYGTDAISQTAKYLSSAEKINLLKSLLIKNTPVMIRIGNGYFHSKIYNPLLGKVVPHWITLWGYDDEKETFYVYDSGMLKKHWDKDIPVGNTTRIYKEILRDWNFGAWQPWTWYNSSESYVYIKINKI